MKQILRSGIGFVGGILFFLGFFLLAQAGKFYNSLPNYAVGIVLMLIGIGLFFYAWRE